MTIQETIQSIQKNRKVTNNTQRVGLRLLVANGEWVPRSRLNRVPSATSRVRDLRKSTFGSFRVECKNSDELNRSGKRTYFYRINPNSVTRKQIQTLFPAV